MVIHFVPTKSFAQRLPLWHQQSREDNSDGSRWSKLDGASYEWKQMPKNETRKRQERILWSSWCKDRRESFVLELMREKDSSHVLKFCTKLNCVWSCCSKTCKLSSLLYTLLCLLYLESALDSPFVVSLLNLIRKRQWVWWMKVWSRS